MTDAYVLTTVQHSILSLISPSTIRAPPRVLDLLRRLHARSIEQEETLNSNDPSIQKFRSNKSIPEAERTKFFDDIMRDKFIALMPDKSVYLYNLIRSTGALNVVEAGTSYGVSTIYLALAVGQNAKAKGMGKGEAKVIATENEAEKAKTARGYWKEAGEDVEEWIELREGDLRETLKEGLPQEIDFVLFDIWGPMVMPTFKLLEPRLRRGAVLSADNTLSASEAYKEFITYLKAEGSPDTTQTLPYEGGLEMAVYLP